MKATQPPSDRNKINVLIVDDSALIGLRIKYLLSGERIDRIEQVFSIEDAIDFIRSNIPEIIILDISLPDGKGIEVIKYVRKCKLTSVIIVFSNNEKEIYAQFYLKEGADFYLDKSREIGLLYDVINEFLDKSRVFR